MYKRIIALLLCALLLSACSSQPDPEETTEGTQTVATTVPATEPVTEPVTEPEYEVPEDGIYVRWDTGNKVLLFTSNDVSVYLYKNVDWGRILYDVQLKNDSTIPVKLDVSDVYFNDCFMSENDQYMTADAGQWGGSYYEIEYPTAAAVGELKKVTRLRFHVKLIDYSLGWATDAAVLLEDDVCVDLSADAALQAVVNNAGQFDITEPCGEYLVSKEQVLLEQDGVRISLLKAGVAAGDTKFAFVYRMENTAEDWRHAAMNGVAVNDVYFPEGTCKIDLQPGAVYYGYGTIDELYGMERLGSMALGLGVGIGRLDSGNVLQNRWYTVVPESAAAEPTPLEEGEILLLEERGLRITLLKEEKDYSGYPTWYLVVVNTTEQELMLDTTDEAVEDSAADVPYISLRDSQVGPGQRTVMTLTENGTMSISFRLELRDPQGYKLLCETEGRVTLIPS